MKEKKNIQHRRLTGKHLPQLTLFYFEDTKLLFFRNVRIIWITGLYAAPLDAGRSINKTGWEDVSNPAATRTR